MSGASRARRHPSASNGQYFAAENSVVSADSATGEYLLRSRQVSISHCQGIR
jgi:hypothetical protein